MKVHSSLLHSKTPLGFTAGFTTQQRWPYWRYTASSLTCDSQNFPNGQTKNIALDHIWQKLSAINFQASFDALSVALTIWVHY